MLERSVYGEDSVIGDAIDITERQKLEDDLMRTSKMLKRTNEIATIGTWEMKLDHQKLYWSPVSKAIHRVPPYYVCS